MSRKKKKAEAFAPFDTTFAVAIHGGYWLLYLLLLAVIFLIAGAHIKNSALNLSAFFPLLVLCLAPNLVSFYAFYFLLFKRFLKTKKIFFLVIFGSFVCLFSTFFGAFLSLAFFGFEQTIFTDAREFVFLAISLFIIAAIHGAIAIVIRGFIEWFGEIKLKEELARKNFEMESMLVKSQINPHFLFNTINNIDVLIGRNAELASEYLNKLSDILRYMVYETRSEKISLKREIEYIEKYLELQKIRTTNADYVDLKIDGDANDLTVAPMIFFPFIENAFKHTENKKNSSKIRIKITIENEKIVFECENSFQKTFEQKQDFGGIGNDLIKKRLTLIYPEKHALEIDEGEKNYRVKLTLL